MLETAGGSARRRRDSRRVTCRRSASRTNARRRSSGNARAGDRCTRRSSGRTGARRHGVPRCPSNSCVSAPASCAIRTSPRRSSSGSSTVSTRPQSRLAFGTVDSWIAWNLTGRCSAHHRCHQCVKRTMLLDLETGAWDDDLLDLFSVERCRAAHGGAVLRRRRRGGATRRDAYRSPAIAGDQQAALFGQGCFAPGEMKATYGTGTFVLAHVGGLAGPADPGLLKTAVAVPAGRARPVRGGRIRRSSAAQRSSGSGTDSG